MNITVIGSGYVGLVSGIIPIFEPGLETMILKNVKNKNLFFTTGLDNALPNSEIVFIAVGTPMGDDGSADLRHVLAVAKSIGQSMQKR